jgi:hypothetical protein
MSRTSFSWIKVAGLCFFLSRLDFRIQGITSLGRKGPFLDQLLPKLDPEGIVHLENRNGHTANGRAAEEDRPFPAKVPGPFVTTRIEQTNQLAGLLVTTANI